MRDIEGSLWCPFSHKVIKALDPCLHMMLELIKISSIKIAWQFLVQLNTHYSRVKLLRHHSVLRISVCSYD